MYWKKRSGKSSPRCRRRRRLSRPRLPTHAACFRPHMKEFAIQYPDGPLIGRAAARRIDLPYTPLSSALAVHMRCGMNNKSLYAVIFGATIFAGTPRLCAADSATASIVGADTSTMKVLVRKVDDGEILWVGQ